MALSNVVREPRRELIESAVGLSLVGVAIWADWRYASWCLEGYAPNPAEVPYPIMFFVLLVVGLVLAAIAFGILVAAHGIGNWLCDGLERHWGLRLRPKQRY
jgi:hypothetical protein